MTCVSHKPLIGFSRWNALPKRRLRRNILQRAHDRVVALHTRAAHALEQRIAQVREQHARPVAGTIAQCDDPARLRAAIEKLADRLIGMGDEEI
jgi:vacuolar-type H+-ATPase subunit F/Vma7